MNTILIEACITDLDGARAAWLNGADRLELCEHLDQGGLTPDVALLERVTTESPVAAYPMIRVRAGDFVYRPHELEQMVATATRFRAMGVHGVVFGALTPAGDIDTDAVRAIQQAAGDVEFTFHRAFDECADPLTALDVLIGLRVTRLLTSGQAATAWEGRQLIATLVERAAGRIVVMAGGGVRPDNARELVAVTNVMELHASLRGDQARIAGISAAVQGG